MRRNWLKRTIDITAASAGLIALAPLLAAVAVAVRVTMGKPILFRQTRPGLGGKPFVMYKFRTMQNAIDADGRRLGDARRMTRLGRFLRAMSLDELPELWNVLRGEMSLVGPRPLLMIYLDRYTPFQARRHEVKPGITGWAQINGRNAISWEERFELDVWYVDNWSTMLDIRILLATIWQVALPKGISADSHPTMPDYAGPTKTNKDVA